ncbi:cutinase [Ceratobasidium sp. AG-Ba]|nr:cutinase [Ceratobasidium sp. AG-Ba]
MPETINTLIAILLVTQSSKGSNEVVFRWPPIPSVRTRLSRPRPESAEPDGSWRAAHYDIDNGYDAKLIPDSSEDTDDYEWHRSGVQPPRRSSVTFPNSPPRTSRGPTPRTPNHPQNSHHPSPAPESNMDRDAYTKLLGYRAAFLADILSPKRSLCHQKFELVVDELAFLGHPVHTGPDGGWGWEELYRSRAASVVERGPEKANNERGIGADRVVDQGTPYVQRSGSFAEHAGLFVERPELSESSASMSSSVLSMGTPRPSQSLTSLSEARGRMPTRPPFDLRMSSSDYMPSPSPAVTSSSSATPLSGASSESSTIPQAPGAHRPLPHVPSHSNSVSHPDSDADSAPQITSFHLVLVLDRLDPRSVSARDLHKYNDVFYQQIAFKMTAVMHYEQGRSGWVARASDKLIALRDECMERDVPFFDYCDRATSTSPLAAAIRNVFESVTRGAVAHIQINHVPLDIQLPPHHLSMLGGGTSTPEDGVDPDADLEHGHPNTSGDVEFEEEAGRAEDARRFGWWLPRLLPWKGLLLLEDAGPGTGVEMIVRMHSGRTGGSTSGTTVDDEGLADEDMFRKFLSNIDPTVSLADIAELSELNLKMDVYPMARLLLYNRKARIVDVIPSGMKVMYTAASAFKRPIPELSTAFSRLFPTVSPLPSLLSTLTSSSQPFSSLIPSRDHRGFYFEILVWLLRHSLIDKLHLRVRIVATPEVRAAARAALSRERENAQLGKEVAQAVATARRDKRRRRRKRRKSKGSDDVEVSFRTDSAGIGGEVFEPSSPEYAVRRPPYGHPYGGSRRRRSSRSSMSSERLSRIPENLPVSVSEEALEEEEEDWDDENYDEDEGGVDGDGEGGGDALWEEDASIGESESVVIAEPAEATQLEMRWMEAMAEGKDPGVAQKFHRLRKYFDGKVTADEILYREDITRRELREVIHHFDAYAIFALAGAALGASVKGLKERQACSAVHMVYLGGTWEEGLARVGTPLTKALASSVPGSTSYAVPYNTTAEYVKTVAEGATMTSDYLDAQVSKCPRQRFVLTGYSKGAMVIQATKLKPSTQSKVFAILVFGDPSRNGGSSSPWPINSPSVDLDPRNGSLPSQNIASFCNKGDPVCEAGGTNGNAHTDYGTDDSTTVGAKFIKARV